MPSPRVLLVRFSAIGDVLLVTPLLRALRRRHPGAHLAMTTRAHLAPLLSDNPHLDAVHPLAAGEGMASLAGRLRGQGFTHLLDLHGSTRSAHLRLLLPGRWTGYPKHRLARALLVHGRRDRYPPDAGPVAERYFAAARELDVEPDGAPPEFALGEGTVAEARAWLAARQLGASRRLVALAPGAAHATKQWPVAQWQAVATALVASGQDVVVVGGPAEVSVAEAVASAGGASAASAAGWAGLQQTGALLAASAAAVTGDTGVMHMATGVGTPVVALFGPTVRQFGFFPYRARATVLERDLPCRPCSYHGSAACPLGHHRCLRDIPAAEVLSALAPWLGGR